MKLEVDNAPDVIVDGNTPKEGNVYRNANGRLYVIFDKREDTCFAVEFDSKGKVINGLSQPIANFQNMMLVGTTTIPDLLSVDWLINKKTLQTPN